MEGRKDRMEGQGEMKVEGRKESVVATD